MIDSTIRMREDLDPRVKTEKDMKETEEKIMMIMMIFTREEDIEVMIKIRIE